MEQSIKNKVSINLSPVLQALSGETLLHFPPSPPVNLQKPELEAWAAAPAMFSPHK